MKKADIVIVIIIIIIIIVFGTTFFCFSLFIHFIIILSLECRFDDSSGKVWIPLLVVVVVVV